MEFKIFYVCLRCLNTPLSFKKLLGKHPLQNQFRRALPDVCAAQSAPSLILHYKNKA